MRESFPENLENRPMPSQEGLDILLEKELIKESGKNPKNWIEENAEEFREVIDEHPEILKLPKQKAKKQIKKWLDKKTIH